MQCIYASFLLDKEFTYAKTVGRAFKVVGSVCLKVKVSILLCDLFAPSRSREIRRPLMPMQDSCSIRILSNVAAREAFDSLREKD